MSIKKRQKRSALLAYIILAVGAVFMIIPFLWMVLTSFKTIVRQSNCRFSGSRQSGTLIIMLKY